MFITRQVMEVRDYAPLMIAPTSAAFVSGVLAPLVQRRASGAPDVELHDELLRAVLPWVRRQVAHNVRRIPSNADASNVSSLMHEAAYHAVVRIDWSQWESWPMYLAALVRRAGQEAARRDDYLSRHQRVLRSRFRGACADAESRLGRALTTSEQREIACSLVGGRADLAENLLIGWHPREMAEVPEVVDHQVSVEDEVERSLAHHEVRVWLEHELPESVRAMVMVWLQTPRSQTLPRRLDQRLRPHVGKLLATVGIEPSEAGPSESHPAEYAAR
jgi:DNA-directed RNA polymerase specialized sigma subunit